MAPGERKSTEPRRRAPAPAGKADRRGALASQVLGFTLPRADRTEKVPRRRKAPDFSNSDVQRATLAIHSLGLVCGLFFFFLFLYLFFFLSVFVLSAPLEMPPLPPLPSLSPGPPAKEPPPKSEPERGTRQRWSPARTCPEVSGARKDAGSVPAEPIPPAGRSRAKTRRPGTSRLPAGLPSL